MKTAKEVHEFLVGLPNTKLDFPFGDDVAVYKVFVPSSKTSSAITGEHSEDVDGDWKMFALVPENKQPVSISLKCDPTLAKVLRTEYESVMEGYHLNKKHWNTMLLTGQLEDQEVTDLILHSYNLVAKIPGTLPDFS